jgi:hypothetical protein
MNNEPRLLAFLQQRVINAHAAAEPELTLAAASRYPGGDTS